LIRIGEIGEGCWWVRWGFYFDGVPEELLFRGLLQNFLERASKSEFAGWWTASMLFGLSHITNWDFRIGGT